MGRLFYLMTVLLFLVSCNRNLAEKELDAETFVKFRDYGLVMGHKYLFKYNESTCQMVNNKERHLLRMQSDDQSSFVNMVFGNIVSNGSPVQDNSKVDVELAYKMDREGEIITLSMGMTVLKREEMKVWLWSREMNMGLIVSPIIKKQTDLSVF